MHAVYNTWLTPVTACGSQSTACGIEMRRAQPWIGVHFILQQKYLFSESINVFFIKQKNIISNKVK